MPEILKTTPVHLFNHQEHGENKNLFPQGLWTPIKYHLYCILKIKKKMAPKSQVVLKDEHPSQRITLLTQMICYFSAEAKDQI